MSLQRSCTREDPLRSSFWHTCYRCPGSWKVAVRRQRQKARRAAAARFIRGELKERGIRV